MKVEAEPNDPFLSFRTEKLSVTTEESVQDMLAAEMNEYATLSAYDADQLQKLLTFWKLNERRLPILSAIAKRILVIQASSAESERHFSTGGMIVNEKRSRLNESSVESLIVLREAYLNQMWPACKSNTQKESGDEEDQSTSSMDTINLVSSS